MATGKIQSVTSYAATKNESYVGDGNVYVARYGNITVVSGRFKIIQEKPAGQSNYLFKDVPIPTGGIAYISNSLGSTDLIINQNGYITSNSAISGATGYFNISCGYVGE